MFDLLIESTWAGPVLWMCLYASDFCLTLTCARLYQAQDKLVFEGSYEITPFFQADINALRRVSPRFVLAFVTSTAYVVLLRRIAGPGTGLVGLYQLALGALLLTQATVHTRHLRNWYMLSRGVGLLKGRLEFPRGIMLRGSAFELFVFAGFYAVAFLMTVSLFVLGGAISCAVLSLKHCRLAVRHDAVATRSA